MPIQDIVIPRQTVIVSSTEPTSPFEGLVWIDTTETIPVQKVYVSGAFVSLISGFENQIPPIGTVQSWLKSYTNTPALTNGWVECNGQTLSDAESVYNGQVIPDLNSGTYRMLRGDTTSGGTGGSDTHTLTESEIPAHTHTISGRTSTASNTGIASGDGTIDRTETSSSTGGGLAHNNLPAYYSVVWIMRVK